VILVVELCCNSACLSEDFAGFVACVVCGAMKVHPSEDPHVIAGQGVVALEALEQVKTTAPFQLNGELLAKAILHQLMRPLCSACFLYLTVSWEFKMTALLGLDPSEPPLDVLVVPVGGGGLASGCATVCKALWPDMLVVGAEPKGMDDAFRSKQQGGIVGNEGGATTIADGLRTQLGPNTWPIVRDLVDAIITVSNTLCSYC
jgi:threonine dehydratase